MKNQKSLLHRLTCFWAILLGSLLALLSSCGKQQPDAERLNFELQQKEAEIAIAQKTYEDRKEQRKDDWRLSPEAKALDARIETLTEEKVALESQLQPLTEETEKDAQRSRATAQEALAKQNNLPTPSATLQALIKTNRGTILALLDYSWAGRSSSGEAIDFKASASTLGGKGYGAQTVELSAGGNPIFEIYSLMGSLSENTFRLEIEETNGTKVVIGAFVATNKLIIAFPEWTHLGNVEFVPLRKEYTHSIDFHFGY